MSGYKVVPVEPTAEMVEAAKDAYMPFGDMDIALRMALLAAPAVQVEPVGWQFYQDGKWWHGDDRIEDHRKNTEEAGFRVRDVYTAPQQPDPFRGDNVALIRSAQSLLSLDDKGAFGPNGIGGHARNIITAFIARISAAPQPAEQQPVYPTCPTCYGRGWDMDCQNEFRPATCPDCAGSGKAEHSITVQESDSAAPDVAALVEALEEIIHPVRFMQERLEEGERLNGMAAVQLAGDASYLRDIAIAALAAHRKQGGE